MARVQDHGLRANVYRCITISPSCIFVTHGVGTMLFRTVTTTANITETKGCRLLLGRRCAPMRPRHSLVSSGGTR